MKGAVFSVTYGMYLYIQQRFILRAPFFWNIRPCHILEERNAQPRRQENLKTRTLILIFRVFLSVHLIPFSSVSTKAKQRETKHKTRS